MPHADRKNPVRAASSESRYSLMEFMRDYPNDDACLESLWRARYSPDGEHSFCPECNQIRVFRKYATSQQRQSWSCTGCGHHLHPTAGTIFHKSSTSLHLWFYAMYLMVSTRCRISAKQLERELGVTYKTAFRTARLIRTELMAQDDELFSGPVEADETYIGGTRRPNRGRHPGGRPGKDQQAHKQPVFGIVQRHGKVAAATVENASRASLMPHIQKRVLPGELVYTDEWAPYNGLEKDGYQHRRIHHAEKVYVSGDVHTNTIEGFWSLLKRGIDGVYHSVSRKHLQGYLNEYAWRYNTREDERAQFATLLLRAALGRG